MKLLWQRAVRSVWRAAHPLWQERRRLGFGAVAVAALSVVGVVILGWSRSDLQSPRPSLWVEDRQGELIGELGESPDAGLGYWPLDEVPPRVVAATLAVEDRRFHGHLGVDPVAIGRALWQNVTSGERISGASTLAMQVARLQRPGARTYGRKVAEASTALWLTARHGRHGVLRQYLRLVPYGNQVFGIAYASRRYFRKPVVDLSWAEVAFLAAIPQAPSRMNPYDPRGRARAVRRGRQILDLLMADGTLNAREHEVATGQIVSLRIPPRPSRAPEMLHGLLTLKERIESERSELTDSNRRDWIYRTYLDSAIQRELAWTAQRRMESWRPRGAGNLAAMVVDLQGPDGPEVVAALGSADYFDQDHAGAINYFRTPRSSGSTLKPFLYALALDRGLLSPTTIMDDLTRGAGGIGNADGRFLGPLLPRVALANSRNVPAANLLADLGLDEGWVLFRRLDLHDRDRSPERHGLGLVLGSLEVSLESLVEAYGALALDGRLRKLRWAVDDPREPPKRVFSENSARLVTQFLADPMARLPSFPRQGNTEPAYGLAVKTGTSSRYRDAWTVAYSSRYLVGVWVGHPDFRPMARLSGYRSAAVWLREIMDFLHPEQLDGLHETGFAEPTGLRAEKVCALTGRRAGPACPQVVSEWVDVHPLVSCSAHQLHAIDRRSGALASHRTPRSEVEIRSFLKLPGRYASWQHRAGIPMPPLGPAGPGSETVAASMPTGTSAVPSGASARVDLSIVSPADGMKVFQDPETPPGRSSIALAVEVEPAVDQILWRVDGEPYALVDYPFETRWHLKPGDHWIQAEIPYSGHRSAAVRIEVD